MSERLFARMAAPLARRVSNMVARGVVSAVNAASKMQGVQVRLLAGEIKDRLEQFEPYGLTAHPHEGAEAVVVFLGGDRSHGVTVVVADRRYRLTGLQKGEVALHDDQGQVVYLTRDGITLSSPHKIRMDAPTIEIHASQSLRFDVNGHGQHWFPTHMDSWTVGATAGTAHPITAPEIS